MSAAPHIIRLRGGWRCSSDVNELRYTRRFGRPTGLTSVDRVELVIEMADQPATVSVNDQLVGDLGRDSVGRFVIAKLLPNNEVALTFTADAPASSDAPVVAVRLEIHTQ